MSGSSPGPGCLGWGRSPGELQASGSESGVHVRDPLATEYAADRLTAVDYNEGGRVFMEESYSKVNTDKLEKAIHAAVEAGFRSFDCAYIYLNEKGVGKVLNNFISKGIVKRDEIFITTKLWNTYHRPELVRQGLENSLAALGLTHVDLYLMHLPITLKPGAELIPIDDNAAPIFDDVDLRQTWEAMEKLKDDGLVKSIGVCNFNIPLLKMILNKPGLKYKPAVNQVESHPFLTQKEIFDFCKSNDIVFMGHSTLGSPNAGFWVDQTVPKLLDDPTLKAIGKKYNKSPAQVAIKFNLQRGCATAVKSFDPHHIRENIQVFDFQLSPEDMAAIEGLNRNSHYWKFLIWKDHPYYHYQS